MTREQSQAARASRADAAPALEVRLLGEIEVVRDGARATLPASKKTRALLAYLCATGRAHLRETLCELLWDGPDDPRAALRWSLTKMRPLLDGATTRLIADRERVSFEARQTVVDVTEVRALLASGVEQAPLATLQAAAARFRGPFLEGLELAGCHRFAAWCVGEREELRAGQVAILRALVTRQRQDPERALRAARTLVTLDPLAESSHLAVVQLLVELGRPREALEQYEVCRRLLDGELHTRPSAEMEKLRIALSSTTPPRPAAPPPPAPAAAPRPTTALPLVGREAESEVIDRALAAARAGEGREVILVLGDPGAGKTRFLEELRHRAGARLLYGRAFEAELVRPYGAWIDALRSSAIAWATLPWREELAPLLPELGAASVGTGDRNRLFEAVARLLGVLAEDAGLLVIALDDLQWFDEASAALLHFLARTLQGRPVLLAAAARQGEIQDNSAALRLLRGLEVDGRLRRLPLAPLGAQAVATLVAAAAPGVDAAAVHGESEGNPLFALEIARSLAVGRTAPTGTLTDLIAQRLGRLDERARQILPFAAALGRSFDPDVLAKVTAVPPADLVAALDELERRNIVRGAGGVLYDFTHDLVRQGAYRQMSDPRRRLVHLQIARALGELPDADGALAGEVAHHAGLGGDDEQAAAACVRATARCLRLFAHAEAAEVAARGLSHAARLRRDRRLHLELALLEQQVMNPLARTRRGREIASQLSRAIVEARDAGMEADAALGLYSRSIIEYNEGQLAAAYQSTVEAAASRRAVDPLMAAEHMGNLAKCLLLIERDAPRAEALVDEACTLAGEGVDRSFQLAYAMGMMAQFSGQLERGVALLERAALIAGREGRRWEECDCLTRIGLFDLEAGRPEAVLARAASLMEVASRMGDGCDRTGAEAVVAVARYALGQPGADAAVEAAVAALHGVDAKGLLATTLNFAAEVDLAAGRTAMARARAEAALRAAAAVDRPSQAALARVMLARLALADGDRQTAAALLEPTAVWLGRRLGLSEHARRAVQTVQASIHLDLGLAVSTP